MPRFQFTIRGLLWATFWAAVSAGAWTLAIRHMLSSEDAVGLGILVLALFTGIFSPFVAVGALFGRPLMGFKVGALILGGVIVGSILLRVIIYAIMSIF